MDKETYEEWKDDERVGVCPYCSAPGWIVGDSEWCKHYAGTDDKFKGSDPVYPLTEPESWVGQGVIKPAWSRLKYSILSSTQDSGLVKHSSEPARAMPV